MKTNHILQLGAALAVALLPLTSLRAQATDTTAPAAPAKKGMKMSVDDRLAMMKTKLGLTDDQVAKIKPILDAQKTAADPIMQDKTLSRDQKREKMKPIMDDTKTKIDAILTPEQTAKVEAARKDRKEKKDQ